MSAPVTSHLEIAGLSVSLGRRQVIRDLSCSIACGQFVGLIGPNGSGKTTLIRAIMGHVPSSGAMRLAGNDVLAMTPRERAKRIAYLPQDGKVVWPMAVEDVVMLGRAPYRAGFAPPSEADRAAVARALAAMDLEGFRRRSARALSGGETARVLIARALAQETDILIADEPTSGLDPAHQIAAMETFEALARAGRTVIASLHDLALAAQRCDRLILLDGGRVAAFGTPEQVLTADTLATVYGVEATFAAGPRGPIVVPVARIAR